MTATMISGRIIFMPPYTVRFEMYKFEGTEKVWIK